MKAITRIDRKLAQVIRAVLRELFADHPDVDRKALAKEVRAALAELLAKRRR